MSNPIIRSDLPSVTRSDPNQAQPKNNALFESGVPGVIFGRRSATSAGLVWGYYGGAFRAGDGTLVAVLNGTVVLAASAHNYVEADTSGAVSANAVGFTEGSVPLYEVYTTEVGVADWIDRRTGTQGSASAGSFDYGISPTWTGLHVFSEAVTANGFATESVPPGVNSRFFSAEVITEHAHYHSLDNAQITYAGGAPIYGHASFNDNTTHSGAVASDHHHSFQSYPHYGTAATLGVLSSFWSQMDTTAGTVTEASGVKVNNPLGAGAITTLYGVKVESLTRGAANWAIHTSGTAPSIFGGPLRLGVEATPAEIRYDTTSGDTYHTPRAGFNTVVTAGKFAVGVTSIPSSGDIVFAKPNRTVGSGTGIVYTYSTDSMAADLGGSIILGGSYTGTSPTSFASIAGRKENGTNADISGYLAFGTSLAGVGITERVRITSAGDTIKHVTGTAPALGVNSQMVMNLTSNTNLRISVRGTDGVTRVANILLV